MKGTPGSESAGETIVVPSEAETRASVETAAALERGRWLFAQECGFVAGAAKVEQIPSGRLAEVAFAGRSNVGKSSLINALTARRTLAKVSNTPGRTRQVNFFELGGRLMLADLPGYGYARASKEQVANWTRVVDHYLVGRAPLRRALLLIDARHGVKEVDQRVMAMLDKAAVSYQVVLTKIDQIKPAELTHRIATTAQVCAGHTAAHLEVQATSAEKGQGVAELRAALAALVDWQSDTAA